MSESFFYRLLADLLLLLHALFIAFVVFGFMLIVIGSAVRWAWVRNFWFRLAHLLAIGLVVAETCVGQICPLTTWENDLRQSAGGMAYSGTFVQHWLQKLIFYDFPAWAFILAYSLFGILVLIMWLLMPPKLKRLKSAQSDLGESDLPSS